MASAANQCPICTESFTTMVRKEVQCPYCRNKICTKCVEKYLLSTIEDPHCLHCHKAWGRNVLNDFCSASFLNKTYFKYRQDVLLNRAKSYLQEWQHCAEAEIEARKIERQSSVIQDEINIILVNHAKCLDILYTKQLALNSAARNMRRLRTPENSAASSADKKKFIRRCTVEGCPGFVSTAWKCGICSTWICPDCYEPRGMGASLRDIPHTCKPEMLETAKLLRKDTKPCPSCGEMITKIDGCDQMWCTSCHSPFSWKNGTIIESQTVHNPHYFQWLQTQNGGEIPRNPRDVPCGGMISGYSLRTTLANINRPDTVNINNIYRICCHITDIERHRYETHLQRDAMQTYGVRYLLKELNEQEWKLQIARDEKNRQKSKEIRDILDAFIGVAITLFQRLHPDNIADNSKRAVDIIVKQLEVELEALRIFTMEALTNTSRSYNCSIPHITSSWDITHEKIVKHRPIRSEDNTVSNTAK